MKLTKESFADLPDQHFKLVKVPAWDNAEVYVKLLSVAEMEKLQSKTPDGKNGVSEMEFAARVCAAGMCDEDGEPIADHKQLMSTTTKAVLELAGEIFDHNGLSDEEKN